MQLRVAMVSGRTSIGGESAHVNSCPKFRVTEEKCSFFVTHYHQIGGLKSLICRPGYFVQILLDNDLDSSYDTSIFPVEIFLQ